MPRYQSFFVLIWVVFLYTEERRKTMKKKAVVKLKPENIFVYNCDDQP